MGTNYITDTEEHSKTLLILTQQWVVAGLFLHEVRICPEVDSVLEWVTSSYYNIFGDIHGRVLRNEISNFWIDV